MNPVRTCVGCGEKGSRKELLRLVADSEGVLTLDPHKRAPGRGAWVHPNEACLAKAESMRAVGRAFRGRVRPPPPGTLLDLARRLGCVP